MTTVTYSDFRANLAHFLDRIEENCEHIVVSRGKGRQTVILSFEDFRSLEETGYLLSSKKNRKHLETSLQEAKTGKTRTVRL